MKLADYVINFLADQGIKHVFVVYGSANGDLVDAFVRNPNIEYICPMHEQGGGFMAEAYSRVSQNFAVAMATSGPGGHNFVTPLGNCYYESVPALFITGQQTTKFMKKTNKIRQNAFQETEIVDIVKPITKYAVMITDPNKIKWELQKALHKMKSGRPGPVLIDIPMNIQKMDINPDELQDWLEIDESITAEASDLEIQHFIQGFLHDLKNAKRPAVMVGGGVKLANCEKELLEFLRFLKVPVFPTWNALDTIASDFEYYGGRIGTYGGEGRNFGIQNCDLLLCLATRVSGRITGGNPSYFARDAKKYIADIDKEILVTEQHDVKFDVKLHCDIRRFLNIFKTIDLGDGAFNLLPPDFTTWNEQVQVWKKKYPTVLPSYYEETGRANPYVFIKQLSSKLKSDDVIITDCGGNVVVTYQSFDTKTGQMFFSNNGNSPMGFSFAAAIGAWFAAKPGQNIIGIIGDGGMNMNIQELQTMVNYKVGAKIVIMNNNIYGITKAFQKTNYEGRFEACGPKGYNPPNFEKIVKAYGIKYLRIIDNDIVTMNRVIDDFLAAPFDMPVVLDLNCHEFHRYIPRLVGWNTPIEDMYPYVPREEFRSNMMIDPVPHWEKLVLPSIEI